MGLAVLLSVVLTVTVCAVAARPLVRVWAALDGETTRQGPWQRWRERVLVGGALLSGAGATLVTVFVVLPALSTSGTEEQQNSGSQVEAAPDPHLEAPAGGGGDEAAAEGTPDPAEVDASQAGAQQPATQQPATQPQPPGTPGTPETPETRHHGGGSADSSGGSGSSPRPSPSRTPRLGDPMLGDRPAEPGSPPDNPPGSTWRDDMNPAEWVRWLPWPVNEVWPHRSPPPSPTPAPAPTSSGGPGGPVTPPPPEGGKPDSGTGPPAPSPSSASARDTGRSGPGGH